jgi:hypothetical protein
MLISLRAVRMQFGPYNFAREIPLVQSFLSGCYSMSRIHFVLAVTSPEITRRNLKLAEHLYPVSSQRMCVEAYLCSNYDTYFVVALRHSCLYQVQTVILEDCPSVPTVISPLKPRGNFMYRRFYTSKEYKYCITAYLCVSYESHNKKKKYFRMQQ